MLLREELLAKSKDELCLTVESYPIVAFDNLKEAVVGDLIMLRPDRCPIITMIDKEKLKYKGWGKEGFYYFKEGNNPLLKLIEPSYTPAYIDSIIANLVKDREVSYDTIRAIVAKESNYNPYAITGHRKGLMGIDERYHSFARIPDKVWDVEANLRYGILIYLDMLRRAYGSEFNALIGYAGPIAYANQVLKLKKELT